MAVLGLDAEIDEVSRTILNRKRNSELLKIANEMILRVSDELGYVPSRNSLDDSLGDNEVSYSVNFLRDSLKASNLPLNSPVRKLLSKELSLKSGLDGDDFLKEMQGWEFLYQLSLSEADDKYQNLVERSRERVNSLYHHSL